MRRGDTPERLQSPSLLFVVILDLHLKPGYIATLFSPFSHHALGHSRNRCIRPGLLTFASRSAGPPSCQRVSSTCLCQLCNVLSAALTECVYRGEVSAPLYLPAVLRH
ncbi:hypothetical protein PoB_002267900 [Plakobranchus ocellatus]|uniref:Secreted protein n=1 Tax=Plakobranchus ocellatus TaxID=259542 RepID=A0AAV3ZQM4_9GAST|nr:hypothetical protein PoB_002267900 [Plakobranchus ocellatus]